MGFAWTFEENFDRGTGQFESETDTSAVIDAAHYVEIAGTSGDPMPWRGSRALKINLAGSATNQYLQEDGGFDIALNATLYIAFQIYITSDLTMAADDLFTILSLQSSGPADEVVVFLTNNSGTIQMGVNETAATSGAAVGDFTLGEWHHVEVFVNLDAGGGDDGTLDWWLDGNSVGSQIDSLNQAAIAQARLGAIGTDSGTTTGRIFIDRIVADDARIFPFGSRFVSPRIITLSEQLFVGPGWVDVASLKSTASDNILRLYDTDNPKEDVESHAAGGSLTSVAHEQSFLLELDPDAGRISDNPIRFNRGCYVRLEGTAPRAEISWVKNSQIPGVGGPRCLSDGSIRNHAMRR
ncbi:hypothetical protein [uncultured Mediterranean phage]|jgi:hypothetical protein|nr:hypothetical protein [uncultured Mediterranean phage]